MGNRGLWKIFDKMGNKSINEKILIVVLIGVFLVLIVPRDKTNLNKVENSNDSSASGENYTFYANYKALLENQITDILKNVENVGEVKVMINFSKSQEAVLAKDVDTVKGNSTRKNGSDSQEGQLQSEANENVSEKTVYGENGGVREPYVIADLMPEIEGVIVVAKGGDQAKIVKDITDALQALLGLEAHKIKVLKMS